MPFYDESRSFVNGFECGMIWQKMKDGEKIENALIHKENIPQFKLMETHYGYEFKITILNDDWAPLDSLINRSIPKRSEQ